MVASIAFTSHLARDVGVPAAAIDRGRAATLPSAGNRHRQGPSDGPGIRLDAVRYIGIQGGRIRAIGDTALRAPVVLDATGMVVAPGFIDLHAHGQTPENCRLRALDGLKPGKPLRALVR